MIDNHSIDCIITWGFIDFSHPSILFLGEEVLTDVIEVAGALVVITIGFPKKLLVLAPIIPLPDTAAFVWTILWPPSAS